MTHLTQSLTYVSKLHSSLRVSPSSTVALAMASSRSLTLPLPEKSSLRGNFHKFVTGFGQRGKARSKRSDLNEEGMAEAMPDEEVRSGEAAAGRIPDEFMKVSALLPLGHCSHKVRL